MFGYGYSVLLMRIELTRMVIVCLVMRSGGSHVSELLDVDKALSTAEHHLRLIKAFMKREAESLAKVQVKNLS